MKLNNEERRLWIMNDEPLYLWWRKSGQEIVAFVKEKQKEIDAIIETRLKRRLKNA